MTAVLIGTCPTCDGTSTVPVAAGGGEYDGAPCPTCCPEERGAAKSEWEQLLDLIPDDGCATPASVFLLRLVTEASIQRHITDGQLLAVAQEVTGA